MRTRAIALWVALLLVPACASASQDDLRIALNEAIAAHDIKKVKELVETTDVDLDPPTQPNMVNKALAYAAIYGNLEIVKYILDQGVDIDGRISYQGTAVLRAAEARNREIAAFLIRSGADVNAANSFGFSMVAAYVVICDPEMLDLVLEHGGEIDLAHKYGNSGEQYGKLTFNPIQWGVAKGELECVKHLLKRGASTEVKTREGESLLELANNRGQSAVAEFLAAEVSR